MGLDIGQLNAHAGRVIRVLAVDDHSVVVEGVIALVSRLLDGVEFVGSASSWKAAEQLMSTLSAPPDVVLMDLHLGDGTTPSDTIATLTAQGIRVVVLTSEVRPVPVRRAIQAGALGLALKSDPPQDIAAVIEAASRGEAAVSSDLAFVLITDPDLTASLPPRELEVLSLLADGVPRKSVGALMSPPVTIATVVTYLNRACDRYREAGVDVRSPQDVLRAAIADGHLDLHEQRRIQT